MLLCFVLFFIAGVSCYIPIKYSEHDPEPFVYSNKNSYSLHLGKLGWLQAKSYCLGVNATLAKVDNVDKANFITDNINQLGIVSDTQNIWIGGRRIEDIWKWVQNKTNEQIATGKGEKFPPWAKGKEINSSFACLAVRILENKMTFRPAECNVTEMFLCERDVEHEATKQNLIARSRSDVYRKKKYTYYKQKVTHYKAVVICSSMHSSLATVPDPETGKHVHNYLSNSTPVLDSVWLNGVLDNGSFVWMSTHERIPSSVNTSVQFPPWTYKVPRPKKECLLYVNQMSYKFVDEVCSTPHYFVCEEPASGIDLEDASMEARFSAEVAGNEHLSDFIKRDNSTKKESQESKLVEAAPRHVTGEPTSKFTSEEKKPIISLADKPQKHPFNDKGAPQQAGQGTNPTDKPTTSKEMTPKFVLPRFTLPEPPSKAPEQMHPVITTEFPFKETLPGYPSAFREREEPLRTVHGIWSRARDRLPGISYQEVPGVDTLTDEPDNFTEDNLSQESSNLSHPPLEDINRPKKRKNQGFGSSSESTECSEADRSKARYYDLKRKIVIRGHKALLKETDLQNNVHLLDLKVKSLELRIKEVELKLREKELDIRSTELKIKDFQLNKVIKDNVGVKL